MSTEELDRLERAALEPDNPFGPVYAAIITNKNLHAGFRREYAYIVRWLEIRFNGAYSRYQITRALSRLERRGLIETEKDERTGKRVIRIATRFKRGGERHEF
ncbi:MAG: hypothetical protein M0P69_17045 [Bacteroidales bacterium]|nr:hypothetical protein [Bacteroidales bacterium]